MRCISLLSKLFNCPRLPPDTQLSVHPIPTKTQPVLTKCAYICIVPVCGWVSPNVNAIINFIYTNMHVACRHAHNCLRLYMAHTKTNYTPQWLHFTAPLSFCWASMAATTIATIAASGSVKQQTLSLSLSRTHTQAHSRRKMLSLRKEFRSWPFWNVVIKSFPSMNDTLGHCIPKNYAKTIE